MTAPPLPRRSPAQTGVWIGIAAITMSFTAYTSALFVRQGSGNDWHAIALPKILILNTLLLALSSVTLERGRRRVAQGSDGAVLAGGTLLLGLAFVVGQVLAWRELVARGLYLSSNPASDFFYVLTALHAIHLLGGITALGYVAIRLRRTPAPIAAMDAVTLYWHFMGVLWLYLLWILATRL